MKSLLLTALMGLTLALGACAHKGHCGGKGHDCKDGSCKVSSEKKECGCGGHSKPAADTKTETK